MYIFVFCPQLPVAEDLDFTEYFEHTTSNHNLKTASKLRSDMIKSIKSKLSSLQVKTAIENYLPYAFSLLASIQGRSVQLTDKITYKWKGFLNGGKSFSSPQIKFDVAMTLVTYALCLSNCAIDIGSDFHKLQDFTGSADSSSDIAANAKECSQLFKKAAGIVEYVRSVLLPQFDLTPAKLPLECTDIGLLSLSSLFQAEAQVFAVMLGTQQAMSPLTLARLCLGCAQLCKAAYDVWSPVPELKKAVIPTLPILLNLNSKHFQVLAYRHLSTASMKATPPQCGASCAYILEAIKLNRECLQVTGVADGVMKIVKDISEQLQKDIETANDDNQHVYFQPVPAFPPSDLPDPAVISKPADFQQPDPIFTEII